MLIFSAFIRLNGANAKDHPVFRELTRVKQYFGKIKDVEIGHQKRVNLTLDKHAAGRVIKHALVRVSSSHAIHAELGVGRECSV